LLLTFKAEIYAKLEEPRLREEKLRSEMDKRLAETQELLKQILENQNKPNP
jgi:hypothetical protein